MRNLRLAGRAATTGLVAPLALATVVSARAPVAASAGGRVPARSDNVVLVWDEAALQAIRDTRPAPTVTARALAMVHASIYEAWAAYDPKAVGTRLGESLRRPPAERTLANRNTAISHAAYRTLVDLFPTRGGANQAGGYADTTGYQPVNTPDEVLDADRWQPLRLPSGAVQAFATPHWYRVTPFALRSAAQFRPDGPVAHVDERGRPNQAYLRQAREALRDSRELDDRSKSIAAWDAKRAYDSVRPITAVRELYRGRTVLAWGGPGRGTRAIRGEDWLPYQPPTVVSPPFAEYVSGHSTFSFKDGDLDGRRLGTRIGANAWTRALGYFAGTATP